ncbi:HlyD family secretion protein [Pelagibius sp. 7325]|uniref:HlyD family secretion protein n=1 Tax=Pelagibius sp. 7325 TaxID=3131994 RepID=UPI0030ECC2D4
MDASAKMTEQENPGCSGDLGEGNIARLQPPPVPLGTGSRPQPQGREGSPSETEAPSHVPNAAEPAIERRPAGRLVRRIVVAVLAFIVLGAAGHVGRQYWTVGRFQVSTDDAYVKADSTTIAPKISGYISSVLVTDNEPVTAGQVLARIDDRDYRTALDLARSNVAQAQAAIANKQAALEAQQAEIEAAKATVAADEATQAFAAQQSERYAALADKQFGSVQRAQQTAADLASSHAALARDKAVLASAIKQLEVLRAELAEAQAARAAAQAAQDQADLNLSYTAIVAPGDGVIGNRTLRVGQYVVPGTQLMALVPVQKAYIVANYKETQLTDVRPGQPVAIAVDMFPGQVFHGRVDSIAPASGQEFALLPPDNATGNFTKIVQRIPVKILLVEDEGTGLALRPGMSVTPTIDTLAEAAGPAQASLPALTRPGE